MYGLESHNASKSGWTKSDAIFTLSSLLQMNFLDINCSFPLNFLKYVIPGQSAKKIPDIMKVQMAIFFIFVIEHLVHFYYEKLFQRKSQWIGYICVSLRLVVFIILQENIDHLFCILHTRLPWNAMVFFLPNFP